MSENIGQLKMMASAGKLKLTDVSDSKGILRLIQSIPSPKAEPFKLWQAQVGSDRLMKHSTHQKQLIEVL